MSDSSTPDGPYMYRLPCGHEGCKRVYVRSGSKPYVKLAYEAAEKEGWVRLDPPVTVDGHPRWVMCPDHAGEAL